MPRIHRTALVSSTVHLADDVTIGPFAILEGDVTLGPGTVVEPHARIIGPVEIGRKNTIGHGAVIGDYPQHRAYKGEATQILIGHDNQIREYVTIHKPMPGGVTRVGDGNMLMVNSHLAHDVTLGHHNTLANNTLIAGHCVVGDRVTFSGHSALHQHVKVGRLAMISGLSASTKDVPPFWMMQNINEVVGVNVVGMRRAGISSAEIQAVRAAFRMIYTRKLMISDAVTEMRRQYPDSPCVMEVADFIQTSKRGICGGMRYTPQAEAA
jgi:UDP-N-acetylglucosamine acyltransferase